MPLAGRCSAAISAACHPPEVDTNALTKALLWGVVDKGAEDKMVRQSVTAHSPALR